MKKLRPLLAVIVVLAIVAGVIYWLRHHAPPERPIPSPQFTTAGRLQIYALDVGQGDGLLVISPGGKAVLIDGGPAGASDAVLAALQRRNITQLDLAVATHPHADHIGGLRRVLERVPVKNFLDSGQQYASDEYARLLGVIRDRRIRFIPAARGQTFEIDSGVKLTALHPQGNNQWITKVRAGGSVENANSVMLRLSYGNFAMLFTGDAEFETEALVMKANPLLSAQVLKIGHHGSRHATSGRFLETVSPQAALISCGADNRYGHPAQATLDRLRQANVNVFRTDLSGELAVISDGKTFDIFPTRQAELAAVWQGRTTAAQ
jgi:competence protein ComEC